MDLFSHTLAEEVRKLKKTATRAIFNTKYENGSESGSECGSESEIELVEPIYKYYLKNVLKYTITIIEIIEKIHERSVIHRDIKPENFMISRLGLQYQQDHEDHEDQETLKKVNIIYFGLSRIYIKDDAHIPNKQNFWLSSFNTNNVYIDLGFIYRISW